MTHLFIFIVSFTSWKITTFMICESTWIQSHFCSYPILISLKILHLVLLAKQSYLKWDKFKFKDTKTAFDSYCVSKMELLYYSNSRPKLKISQRRPLYEWLFAVETPNSIHTLLRSDSIVFKYSSQNHLSILFEERRKNNESKKETKYTLWNWEKRKQNKTKIQLFKTENNQVEFKNKGIDCFI